MSIDKFVPNILLRQNLFEHSCKTKSLHQYDLCPQLNTQDYYYLKYSGNWPHLYCFGRCVRLSSGVSYQTRESTENIELNPLFWTTGIVCFNSVNHESASEWNYQEVADSIPTTDKKKRNAYYRFLPNHHLIILVAQWYVSFHLDFRF